MVVKLTRLGAAAVVVLLGFALFSGLPHACAQSPVQYNYYVAPTPTCLGASLYPCPRPTPAVIGHTYITYQALNPHEFLYRHHRKYYTPHPSGVTKTIVVWNELEHSRRLERPLRRTFRVKGNMGNETLPSVDRSGGRRDRHGHGATDLCRRPRHADRERSGLDRSASLAMSNSSSACWHGSYYHKAWGMPLAWSCRRPRRGRCIGAGGSATRGSRPSARNTDSATRLPARLGRRASTPSRLGRVISISSASTTSAGRGSRRRCRRRCTGRCCRGPAR